jgi:outer membrane protein OmpA-like peptidoglycan-associated protein/tetratricopeptide (TPR) repeat protein
MSRNFGVASIFVLMLTFLPRWTAAQQVETFLKKGDRALKLADDSAAHTFFTAGLALAPDHIQANIRMGRLHLRQKKAGAAVRYLRKARKLSPNQLEELPFLLAEAYHLSYSFDSALTHYQEALRLTRKKDYDQQELIQKRMEECRAGLSLLPKPALATVSPLGAPVNSPFADHVPVLNSRGDLLVFTSRRGSPASGTGQGKEKEGKEDVYFSRWQEGAWEAPQKFAAPINSASHEAALALSADGKELYLYKDYKGGGIYVSRQTPAGQWSEPEALGAPFNSAGYEPSISLSDDGQYAFFSSDREGGLGGLDLYVAFRQPDGLWSEALNLGPAVNSPFDEDAPYIDSKNNVLFFSSRGHDSMGGYDIFRSSINGSLWSQAENMGLPVNSPFDDIYFILSPDEKHGYYASDRPGGMGEKDIYLATFTRPRPALDSLAEAPEPTFVQTEPEVVNNLPLMPENTAAVEEKEEIFHLTGTVVGEKDDEHLSASITVYNQESNEVVSQVGTTQEDASFAFALEKDKAYRLQVEKTGFFFHTDRITLPQNSQQKQLQKKVVLRRLSPGAKVVLENILFEFNKMDLKAESKLELDLLYQLLAQNEFLKVEVSGHTDNRGTVAVNQRVSEQRAKAVVQHLIGRGIDPKQIRAVGYGLTRPIASNATEEGRQRNRRTEFSVLSVHPNPTPGANGQERLQD